MSPPSRQRQGYLVELAGGDSASTVVYAAAHAGAGVEWASDLRQALSSDWAVCGVLLPGRGARRGEPFATSVESAAVAVANEVCDRHCTGRRAVFYGQSLGALLAFDVCRLLERGRAVVPTALVVQGAPAPQTSPRPGAADRTDEEIIDELVDIGATPAAVLADAGLRAMILAILRSDLHLYESYGWGTCGTIAAPIVAVRGAEDPSVTAAAMREWASSTRSTRFEYVEVPGGHLPTRQAAPVWAAWVDQLRNPVT